VDSLERLVISNYDYGRALALLDDDVVILEWDVAVEDQALTEFCARAEKARNRVRVAPYLLYPVSSNRTHPVWAHRLMIPGGAQPVLAHKHSTELSRDEFVELASGLRWVSGPEEAACTHFGLGMAYLPRSLVAGFLTDNTRLTDQTFSHWHWDTLHRLVPIDWDIRPVHLHN